MNEMSITRGVSQWTKEGLLCISISIVISTSVGSAIDVPDEIVHFCDDHQKSYNSHDNIINEENSIKSVESDENDLSNGGDDDSNDKNNLDKSGTLHNTNFLDDIQHTTFKNVSVLYLAGYDDEIFKLRNDLLEMGEGDELIVYFFLYKEHKYCNIGKLHTNRILFKKILLKYTHYYYIDLEKVINMNLNKLGFEDSKENVPNQPDIENRSHYYNVHPQKERDGSYNFIIPKEKDMTMNDIIVNLNKIIDDKLNKPGDSTADISPLLNELNDNGNFYVKKDFLNPCTHGKYLYKKDKKINKNKDQVLKPEIKIIPPLESELEIEDNLNKESISILPNTKKVPCNYGKVEQTIENVPTSLSVMNLYEEEKGAHKKKNISSNLTSTAISEKSKDTEKTDVAAKGFNIVAPISFRGRNHVRPNYSQYYLNDKSSNDILVNSKYNDIKPNAKTFSHIHATNQYSPNKKIPNEAMSKYTNYLTQIENFPFDNFKPLPPFSDESYSNLNKMIDSNISYDNNYISNPNYATFKQNIKPLENKKYSTNNPVAYFNTGNVITPVITSTSKIKMNDEMPLQWNIGNKKFSYLPQSCSLYQGKRASQKQKYVPDKSLIQAPSILHLPCQKQRGVKSKVLAADSKNILSNYENIPRGSGAPLVNPNIKLSSNAQVYSKNFYSTKYNMNNEIRPKEIKKYPYYSKYNEPLTDSYIPNFYTKNKNFISTTPYSLTKELSGTNVNILNDYKTSKKELTPKYGEINFNDINYWPIHKASNNPLKNILSKFANYNYKMAPAQFKSDFTNFKPNLYQPIPTKIDQALDNTVGNYDALKNMNPNINQNVNSDFPMASEVLSKTERLTPFLSKGKLKKPCISPLPLRPSIELNQIKPQNFALPSSDPKYLLGQESTEPGYNDIVDNKIIMNIQQPLNVVEPKAEYAFSKPKINVNLIQEMKNFEFMKKFPIPNLSTLKEVPYVNASWFKKYHKNIPELLSISKYNILPKIKPSFSGPIYSNEVPKSHILMTAKPPPVFSETISMSEKPVNILEFPISNDLIPSNVQGTQFVSLPKSNINSNLQYTNLPKRVKKQNLYLLRPKNHQLHSKYHLSPEPQNNTVSPLSPCQASHNKVKTPQTSSYLIPLKLNKSYITSDSKFKLQHPLKSNVTTLNRETDTSDVFSNKNLHSLVKSSQYRNWPQNVLPLPTAGQYIAFPEGNKKLYRPMPIKEYPLKSYSLSSSQVGKAKAFLNKSPITYPLSKVSSPPLIYQAIPNQPIIQETLPIPSYIKLYKVNISDVTLKSMKPICSHKFPTKDTVFNENLGLQTNPYLSKPLQYHTWPQNIIPSPITLPYFERDQNLRRAKHNFDQYPLRPYLSRKPQSVQVSFPITSLPAHIPPISAMSNRPQYILTTPKFSQHAALPKINKYLHLPKQKVYEYPPKSYSAPQTVTKNVFSIQSLFTSSPKAPSSSSSSPLYKTVPNRPIIQDISLIPSYIKPFKQLPDIPSSIFPLSRQPFKSSTPNFIPRSPTTTDTVCNKNLKLQTNHYIKKPLQYHHWPASYAVTPEKSQNLYIPKQHFTEYPMKRYFLSKPKSVPAIPITSSSQSPTLAIRFWPQNILTSPISSQYVAMPKRNKLLPNENFSQYPPESYSKLQSVTTNDFPIKSPILPFSEVSSFSSLPLYETVPSFSYIKPHKQNIFTLPQHPLNSSTPNFDLESPTITYTKPLQYHDWPQNIISSSSVVTLKGNRKLHPTQNINQFHLKPYLSSAFSKKSLTSIPALKSSSQTLVPTSSLLQIPSSLTSTLPMLSLPNSFSTFLPTAFPSSLQMSFPTSLKMSLPTPVSTILPTSLPITSPTLLPTTEIYPLPRQFSLPCHKLKVLPTNNYTILNPQQIPLPSLLPSSNQYLPSHIFPLSNKFHPYHLTSPDLHFVEPSFDTYNININTKPINDNIHVFPKNLKQFTPFNNYDYKKPQASSENNSIPSLAFFPINKFNLKPGSITFNSHLAHLLPNKVFQSKITPRISSYSNLLLENSKQSPISAIQGTVLKAKENKLFPINKDNINNKMNYTYNKAIPVSNSKSYTPHLKVSNQIGPNSDISSYSNLLSPLSTINISVKPNHYKHIAHPMKLSMRPQYFHSQNWNTAPYSYNYSPLSKLKTYSSHKPYICPNSSFSAKMQDLKSPNSVILNDIISNNFQLPFISSSNLPYKLDYSRTSSSTLTYPVEAFEPPSSPIGKSILPKSKPSQFRPLRKLFKDQPTKLPTKWNLLKKPLMLPFKTAHHPNYEPLQTLGTKSSDTHLNVANHFVRYTKPKIILKSTHMNHNYPTLNEEQVYPEKETSFKPYTSEHNVYPLKVQEVKMPTSNNPQPISGPLIPLNEDLLNIPHSKKTQTFHQTPASMFSQLYQPNVINPRPVCQSKITNAFNLSPSSTLPSKRNLFKSPIRSNTDHFKPYYTYLTTKFPLKSPLHYNYETSPTVNTEPSITYKKIPNQFTWSQTMPDFTGKYKNNQPLMQQNQANLNEEVINTQPTFSQISYLPAPSLKTPKSYPSYKPYTFKNTIYPLQFSKTSKSLSIDNIINKNLPLQSNLAPFKQYTTYKSYIKSPSDYQKELIGTSSPINTGTLSIPSTKRNLFANHLAPIALGSFKPSSFLPHSLLSLSSIALHDPGYKTLPTVETKTSASPYNILNKTTWPQNTPKFTSKNIGQHQNYLSFTLQDQSNENSIKTTQPITIPFTKVAPKKIPSSSFKSSNTIKSYPTLKPYTSSEIFNPLNFGNLRVPYLFNEVGTANGNALIQSEPISQSQTSIPILDYYQTKSPYQLAWTKTIPTGEFKGTSYNIQPPKLPRSWYLLKKSLATDVDTLKPYLTLPIKSPSLETYPSRENADILINKASAFEKESPSSIQSNLQAPRVFSTLNRGTNKIKYFTSKTGMPNKIVTDINTGKYSYMNYLQKKPITNDELYSDIFNKNENYKKYYSTILAKRPIQILNSLKDVNSDEVIKDDDRNLNVATATILNNNYEPNLYYQEIFRNNKNLPYIRTQGTDRSANGIPSPNISILKYDPREISKGIEIETDNPDIFIKAWTSKIEVIKPRIVYDKFKVNAINFEPIVKEIGKYDPYVLEDIVKSYVERYYGEPIVLKGSYNFYKPYIISNVGNEYLKHGKIYIVWPTLCGCGCKSLGCRCPGKLLR